MRVLYQPTQDSPADWEQTDESLWARLNSFTCHALCVQGVTFDGADYYSVESVSSGVIRVVVWYDSDDWVAGQRWARVWTFSHLAPDPDPRFGGALRPQHIQTIYAEAGIRSILEAAYGNNPAITFQDWSAFDPNRTNPMAGRWVTDEQHADQCNCQSVQGWRTWTEGLDPFELDANGRVRNQRKMGRYEVPRGTRTYYHNGTNLSIPVYSVAVDNENELGLSPAGVATEMVGGIGPNGLFAWAAATPSGEPNSAAWPTTGVYRYQLDVTAVGADLTFGLLTQGTGNDGGFARLDSGMNNELQLIVQDQSAFSGPATHLASITDPAWTAGASSDRFAVKICAFRPSGHGNQTMTLELGESDDFADGPWAAAPPVTDNATFFGANF